MPPDSWPGTWLPLLGAGWRLAIGLIGASFVLTQYHTSIMFSRSVVGTANAVTAGWGNLGGGVTQWIMPLLFGAIIGLGADKFLSWRLAMIVPGAFMLITGLAYYRLTEDTPDGRPFVPRTGGQAFWEAAGDYRVWLRAAETTRTRSSRRAVNSRRSRNETRSSFRLGARTEGEERDQERPSRLTDGRRRPPGIRRMEFDRPGQ